MSICTSRSNHSTRWVRLRTDSPLRSSMMLKSAACSNPARQSLKRPPAIPVSHWPWSALPRVIFVATMVETFSVERRKIMRALGAKVILTPAAEKGTGMVKKAEELAKKHGWFLARQFENPANPAYHRNTTGPEILRDFAGKRLDYWVSGWGTGVL